MRQKVGENRVRHMGDPACDHVWAIGPVTDKWAVASCYRCREVRDVFVEGIPNAQD